VNNMAVRARRSKNERRKDQAELARTARRSRIVYSSITFPIVCICFLSSVYVAGAIISEVSIV
jgi:hypothetical protein